MAVADGVVIPPEIARIRSDGLISETAPPNFSDAYVYTLIAIITIIGVFLALRRRGDSVGPELPSWATISCGDSAMSTPEQILVRSDRHFRMCAYTMVFLVVSAVVMVILKRWRDLVRAGGRRQYYF